MVRGSRAATLALLIALGSTWACDSAGDSSAPEPPQPDPSASPASGGQPSEPAADPAPQAMPSPGCAAQSLDSTASAVHGTVSGPNVEGAVCDNGLGTFFLGPEDSGLTAYDQEFFTTTANGAAAPGAYGFRLTAPAAALSGALSGWTGVSEAAAATYDSTTNCGWLDFVVTLPVPPGVVCASRVAPCAPGCEGTGEASLCEPAPARMHYQARSAATCQLQQEPPEGDWQLTVTSVAPLAAPNGYRRFETHGELASTLVNLDDATDSITLSLDF